MDLKCTQSPGCLHPPKLIKRHFAIKSLITARERRREREREREKEREREIIDVSVNLRNLYHCIPYTATIQVCTLLVMGQILLLGIQ